MDARVVPVHIAFEREEKLLWRFVVVNRELRVRTGIPQPCPPCRRQRQIGVLGIDPDDRELHTALRRLLVLIELQPGWGDVGLGFVDDAGITLDRDNRWCWGIIVSM